MLIIFYSCSSSKKEHAKSSEESLTYELINYVIESKLQNFQNEYSRCKYLLDKEPYTVLSAKDSIRLIHLDTLFSKKDLDTIFKQNLAIKDFSINPKFLNVKIEIISSDTLIHYMDNSDDFWDQYYNKFGRNGFAIVSRPLFSLDRQTAIIKYSCQYHGLNGEFNTLIYKRKNNRWEVIHVLNASIS